MPKRKKQFMDDDYDSSDDGGSIDDHYMNTVGDDDEQVMEGFGNFMGRRKNRRKQAKGFDEDEYESDEPGSFLKKGNLSFVKSSTKITDEKHVDDDSDSTSNSGSSASDSSGDSDTSESSSGDTSSESSSDDDSEKKNTMQVDHEKDTFKPSFSTEDNSQIDKDNNLVSQEWTMLSNMQFSSTRGISKKPITTEKVLRTMVQEMKTKKNLKEKVDRNFASFEKHTKGIGLKLMMKMGYKPGEALGAEKEGLVNPIDVKLRPKQMGLGHGGFDERTEIVKKEMAVRKSEESEEEDEKGKEMKKKGKEKEASQGLWKRSTSFKKKKKTHYKTVDELIQEQEAAGVPIQEMARHQKTKIIDMTGRHALELKDLSQVKSNKPLYDTIKHLPELRYNLKLIHEMNESEMAKKVKLLRSERNKADSMKKERLSFDSFMTTLRSKTDVVGNISELIREAQDLTIRFDSLESMTDALVELLRDFHRENNMDYWQYRLDAVVASLILSPFKKELFDWDPLKEPKKCANIINKIKFLIVPPTLKMIEQIAAVSAPGTENPLHRPKLKRVCIPFETLLYTIWLPNLRSYVCNEWQPMDDSDAIIELLETWFPSHTLQYWQPDKDYIPEDSLMPYWLYNNILEQLILPKLKLAIEEQPNIQRMKTESVVPLHQWVFPWLPLLGPGQISDLMIVIRQKISQWLSSWQPSQIEIVDTIFPWSQVMSSNEFDSILSKSILPKLILVLRNEFILDPRNQDLKPLNWVVAWKSAIRDVLFGNLILTEFFPKWLDILKKWLLSPQANYEEITQWYTSWKKVFPTELLNLPEIQKGFRQGLDLMNLSMTGNLSDKTSISIETQEQSQMQSQLFDQNSKQKNVKLTFKDIVEQAAAANDLLFIQQNQIIAKGIHRHVVYSLGGGIHDTRGSVLLYMDDGVLFVYSPDDDDWKPKSIEDTMTIVSKKKQLT